MKLLTMIDRFLKLKNAFKDALVDLDMLEKWNEDNITVLQKLQMILTSMKLAVEDLSKEDANLLTAEAVLDVKHIENSHRSPLGSPIDGIIVQILVEGIHTSIVELSWKMISGSVFSSPKFTVWCILDTKITVQFFFTCDTILFENQIVLRNRSCLKREKCFRIVSFINFLIFRHIVVFYLLEYQQVQ